MLRLRELMLRLRLTALTTRPPRMWTMVTGTPTHIHIHIITGGTIPIPITGRFSTACMDTPTTIVTMVSTGTAAMMVTSTLQDTMGLCTPDNHGPRLEDLAGRPLFREAVVGSTPQARLAAGPRRWRYIAAVSRADPRDRLRCVEAVEAVEAAGSIRGAGVLVDTGKRLKSTLGRVEWGREMLAANP